jgi:hypothetical protein
MTFNPVSHVYTVVVVCAIGMSLPESHQVIPRRECVPRTRVISDLPDYPKVDYQELCLSTLIRVNLYFVSSCYYCVSMNIP